MSARDIDSYADDEASSPFDLKEVVLLGLVRSRYLVLACAAIAFGIAFAYAASIPNDYTATASLRYTPGMREASVTPEAAIGDELGGVQPGIVEELLLLKDLRVFQSVAEDYGVERILIPADPTQYDRPDTNPAVRWLHAAQRRMIGTPETLAIDPENPDLLEYAAKRLQGTTEFAPVPRSSIIEVTHTASSKERAYERLGLILDACIDRHRDQYKTEERFERSRAREAELYSELEVAKSDFQLYRAECGVDNVEASLTRAVSRVGELEDQIAELESQLSGNESELQFLGGLAETMPEEIESVTPAVLVGNRRYDSLASQREEAAIDLILLEANTLTPFAEKELQQRILELRIAEYDKRLEGLDPVAVQRPEKKALVPNPEWVALQRQISQIEGAQRAARVRVEFLKKQLDLARGEIEHVRSCESTFNQMREVIEDVDDEYRSAAARNDELEVLTRLDETGASNLSRYLDPNYPEMKDGPPREKIALGGLAAGLMIGAALAILRQLFDRRLRYPATVERDFQLPVLCAIPDVRPLRGIRKRTQEA